MPKDDIPRRYFFAIDSPISVVIGTDGGTFERDTCKCPPSARIAQDFCPQAGIALRRGGSPDGAGCHGCVAAKFHFAGEYPVRSAVIHNEKNEVRGFSADLQPETSAFQGHH